MVLKKMMIHWMAPTGERWTIQRMGGWESVEIKHMCKNYAENYHGAEKMMIHWMANYAEKYHGTEKKMMIHWIVPTGERWTLQRIWEAEKVLKNVQNWCWKLLWCWKRWWFSEWRLLERGGPFREWEAGRPKICGPPTHSLHTASVHHCNWMVV